MRETPKALDAHEATTPEMSTMDDPQGTANIAWLAGIMDGEGYVSICMNQHKQRNGGEKRAQFTPRVSVGSTSAEIIEKCSQTLHLIGVGHLIKDRTLKSKKCFKSLIVVGAKRVGKLLPYVMPHLTLKRPNAERIMQFIASRLSKPMTTTYTEYELGLVNACRTGPSQTTREAPALAG